MNKMKKVALCGFCMVFMMLSTFIVSTAASGTHSCVKITKKVSYQSTVDQGDFHSDKYYVEYVCQICGNKMEPGQGYEYFNAESHTYYNGHYDDLGHNNRMHKYKLYCSKCTHTLNVTILCDMETGKHSTPY